MLLPHRIYELIEKGWVLNCMVMHEHARVTIQDPKSVLPSFMSEGKTFEDAVEALSQLVYKNQSEADTVEI